MRGVRGIIHTTHYTSDGNFQNLPTFTTEGAFNKVPWELGASGVDERARARARLGWGSGLGGGGLSGVRMNVFPRRGGTGGRAGTWHVLRIKERSGSNTASG